MSTPLVLAASGGHLEIVTLLINAGALINHMDIVSIYCTVNDLSS